MIKLIVGLGNPGKQYEKTRHNAGFLFLDSFSRRANVKWNTAPQFQADMASVSFAGSKLLLLRPLTFMNRSGVSVGGVLRYYKLVPEEMLVVHDEIDLPEGVVKLKRDGGHAGHNGVRDIITHAGSRDFYRLRIGVGKPEKNVNVADYVLSSLPGQAIIEFEKVFQLIVDKVPCLIAGDVAVFNNLSVN